LIHGESATAEAIHASEILFGGDLEGIPESAFNDVIGEAPAKDLEKARLEGAGTALVELLVQAGLSSSKGQARKDIEGGGIYLNNLRETNCTRLVTSADLLFGRHLLLRKGKRTYTTLTAR
jgi:tyrosyl-tRNA synthetase